MRNNRGMSLPPLVNPQLNPTGYMAAASAIYAATAMIVNAVNHHGVINVAVIVAALTAVTSLLTRQIVTPVAAPKDGNGNALTPAAPLSTSATLLPAPGLGTTGEPPTATPVSPV